MENQVELMGYTTKNFDICMGAVQAFTKLKAMIPDMSKQSREDVLSAMKYQDAMFGIEKALYEIGSTEVDMDQVEEAVMLSHMTTYAIGMVSAELDMEIVDMFDYLPMHIEQIRHPYKKINPALPDKAVEEEKTMSEEVQKEYGEGRMARASLRKMIMYAGEMLSMIEPDDEMESWVQAKMAEMDHMIEAVYTYYKFGERYEPKPQAVHADEDVPMPPTAQGINHVCALSVQHEKMGFGMCIPTTHSLEEDGTVEFYDVVFSNGIAKGVPAKDLKIIESKSHTHS
tara:strand:+ start:1871 stop:2725 length:855 start_codon:yes stop_codon:yes gene_type:complete